MGFKMKKPSITQGTAAHKKAIKDYQELQLNREMEQNMPDGRSMSSPFQKNEGKYGDSKRKVESIKEDHRKGKYKEIGGKARPPKAVEEKAIKLSDQKKARMEKTNSKLYIWCISKICFFSRFCSRRCNYRRSNKSSN